MRQRSPSTQCFHPCSSLLPCTRRAFKVFVRSWYLHKIPLLGHGQEMHFSPPCSIQKTPMMATLILTFRFSTCLLLTKRSRRRRFEPPKTFNQAGRRRGPSPPERFRIALLMNSPPKLCEAASLESCQKLSKISASLRKLL